MTIYDIIYKKRNNQKLSSEEIEYVITKYTCGEMPDYQMSAFLMAAFIRGLDTEETSALTLAMRDSGKVMDLSDIDGIKVDKHSTGGVGDGTSLIAAPLAACAGLVVPMMAGRGLGHTGGTLDKLESMPGFNVNLSESQFKRQLKKIGVAIIGQTSEIAPADKKIYALRDVTATVDSLPLISASIMSKKLAEGCDALILDIKTGSGAFMKDLSSARQLAQSMVNTGRVFGKKVSAVISDMNQPLGTAVGNELELKQSVEILKGSELPKDFFELSLELAARMLISGNVEKDLTAAKSILRQYLKNGKAFEKFLSIVEAQGGDIRIIDKLEGISKSRKEDILSPQKGYINSINTQSIGLAGILTGAGRKTKEDKIDYSAGFVIHKKIGDFVEINEPLATVYYNTADAAEAKKMFVDAYQIGEVKPGIRPLIYESF